MKAKLYNGTLNREYLQGAEEKKRIRLRVQFLYDESDFENISSETMDRFGSVTLANITKLIEEKSGMNTHKVTIYGARK